MAELQMGNNHRTGFLGEMGMDDAGQMMDQTREAMDQAVQQASEFIREKPLACLAGALALGYVFGKIVSR